MSGRWKGTTPRIVDAYETGWFRMSLRRGGWEVPAAIERDEFGLWRVIIDGKEGTPHTDPVLADVDRVWTRGRRIEEWEYRGLLELRAWALKNDPEHPSINPLRAIEPNRLKSISPPGVLP